MPRVRVRELDIEYRTTGDAAHPPLLLLMGTGATLAFWDDDFCARLAALGLFVIRFDARDTGHSSRTAGAVPGQIAELLAEVQAGRLAPHYGFAELAEDALGLLDALVPGRPAHLLGISQGGALAQVIALRAPARVITLTMIAGYTSDPATPPPAAETMAMMLTPFARDRDGMIAREVLLYRALGSPTVPPSDAWLRARAERVFDHGYDPSGFLKHLLAVITASNRKPLLDRLPHPALVIHGDADPIIPCSEAEAIATALPNAELLVVAGMGHDLAPEFWAQILAKVAPLIARGGAVAPEIDESSARLPTAASTAAKP